MSEAAIAKKETLVQAAAEKFESAASVVIVDYRGLTVEEVTNLRKQLRDAGVEMKVIKNSILSRAAKKVGLDGLDEVFTGPTAVAFSNDDVVAPATVRCLAFCDILRRPFCKNKALKQGITGQTVPAVDSIAGSFPDSVKMFHGSTAR